MEDSPKLAPGLYFIRRAVKRFDEDLDDERPSLGASCQPFPPIFLGLVSRERAVEYRFGGGWPEVSWIIEKPEVARGPRGTRRFSRRSNQFAGERKMSTCADGLCMKLPLLTSNGAKTGGRNNWDATVLLRPRLRAARLYPGEFPSIDPSWGDIAKRSGIRGALNCATRREFTQVSCRLAGWIGEIADANTYRRSWRPFRLPQCPSVIRVYPPSSET